MGVRMIVKISGIERESADNRPADNVVNQFFIRGKVIQWGKDSLSTN